MCKRISHFRFFLFFVIFAILLSCSQDKETPEKTSSQTEKTQSEVIEGGVYRLPLAITPATLDPAYIEDHFGVSVAYQLFDGLVQYGPYLNVLPSIAKDWKIEDEGKTVKFFLRDNVFFHDGRRVTAEDVVFSLTRLFNVDPAPSILPHLLYIKGTKAYLDKNAPHISGLRVLDDHLLEIQLTEPYAPLLRALAMYQASIVPQHILQEKGKEFSQNPVGSGPFKFVEWQPDQLIRLERYTEYYSGASYLDGIEYHIYPGAQRSKVLKDFQSGLLEEMPVFGTVRQSLSESKKYTWIHRPSLSLLFYGTNIKHSHLDDRRLRKALSLSVNRDQLVNRVYSDQFEAARTFLPPGMPAHNRNSDIISDNQKEAKALISEVVDANPERELMVEIVSASKSAFAQAEFKFIKESWAEIGVDTTIKYITDWSSFEQYLDSDSMQIYRYSWTADMPDPDNFLRPLFGSDSSVNYTGYKNKEIDQLLKEAAGTVDDVKRARLYQEIEEKVMHDHPVIPLFYLSIDRVYNPKVRGIHSSVLGWQAVRMHRTWLDPSVSQ